MNILCYLGLHDWEIIKSVTQALLLYDVLLEFELDIKNDPDMFNSLKQKHIDKLSSTISLERKICIKCGKRMNEIDSEKEYLKLAILKCIIFDEMEEKMQIDQISNKYWYQNYHKIPINIKTKDIKNKDKNKIKQDIRDEYLKLEKKIADRKEKAIKLWHDQ